MHPFFAARTPIAIGHRGCAGETPENTLVSFERALGDGAAVLETDVHLTRDGVPVLIHDPDVARTTDGHGAVCDLDWEALCRFDAGYRFTTEDGGTPYRGDGLRIPSLEQALASLPDVRFNLELKHDAPGIVERTLAVLREAGREEATLVTAADDALMARLRDAVARSGSAVALGACTGEVAAFARAARDGQALPPGPMALQIPAAFAGRRLVTDALLDAAHDAGVHVHVWTINEPAEIDALIAQGVDGIVSDYPARVVLGAGRHRRG